MTFDWAKFDKTVDLKGLDEKIKEAKEGGNYPEIPEGKYEVEVDSMELGQSKKKSDGSGGDPMVKIVFKIVDGEFKGQKIFYNGVIQPWNEKAFGYQVHRNNEMLEALSDGDVKFTNFAAYNEIILDIFEEIDGWNYVLEKSKDKKGYDQLNILEILD